MNFGAHIFLWTDRWTRDSLPLLERAHFLGLNMLELSCGDDLVDDFHPAELRAEAEKLGLELTLSPGNFWPMEADISHQEKFARLEGLAWHRSWIERAGEAGMTAYCGALYAHPGRVERRAPDPDEFHWAAENLHSLAEFGAACGVAIVIEPMSHFRTHLVNTPEQAMRLIVAADHSNLRVLFDTYHAVTEVRDYAAAIRTLAPRLWGLHACESDRGVPRDRGVPGNRGVPGGLVPWDAVFTALTEIGFDGNILFESYNSSLNQGDFAYSRGMFHNVCPDGDAYVRQGLRFIQSFMT